MMIIGMPVYNIVGNHDMNFDADLLDRDPNRFARETYKSYYGPTYYSFAHGDVHFIVMDNIDYQMRIESPGGNIEIGELEETDLVVNVFNGSELSQVRYRINDGDRVDLERVST